MTKIKPTAELLEAVNAILPGERSAAMRLADKHVAACLSNHNFTEEFFGEGLREAVCASAAAEITYRFA